MEILRKPTQTDMSEREFGEGTMIPLSTPGKRIVKSPQDRFEEQIAKEEKRIIQKALPFAINVLRAETAELARTWETRWRRRGYVDDKNDPQPKVDWTRYSDLDNFEVLDSGEKHDPQLSKVNKFPVFVKWSTYQFKGFPNKYTVMESAEAAVDRALEKFKGDSFTTATKPSKK